MKSWGAIGLLSLGGLTESAMRGSWHDAPLWGLLAIVSTLGWCWTALYTGGVRLWSAITGKRPALAQTDPRALAAEVQALNAQISQLRDTATSFDMAFDRNLECLDDRLRQVEQRTTYAHPQPSVTVARGQ